MQVKVWSETIRLILETCASVQKSAKPSTGAGHEVGFRGRKPQVGILGMRGKDRSHITADGSIGGTESGKQRLGSLPGERGELNVRGQTQTLAADLTDPPLLCRNVIH